MKAIENARCFRGARPHLSERQGNSLVERSGKRRAVICNYFQVRKGDDSMRRSASLFSLCLLLVLGASESPAAAKSLPFKGSVSATWDNIFDAFGPDGATFEGGGPVTHMGKTTQTGILFLSSKPNADGRFPGHGSVTITAANGDQLTFDYQGLLDPVTGEGKGTFCFTGGTGRFANATGRGIFDALIDLSLPDDQPMTVSLDGTIDY
jgi:hypothetical protein